MREEDEGGMANSTQHGADVAYGSPLSGLARRGRGVGSSGRRRTQNTLFSSSAVRSFLPGWLCYFTRSLFPPPAVPSLEQSAKLLRK